MPYSRVLWLGQFSITPVYYYIHFLLSSTIDLDKHWLLRRVLAYLPAVRSSRHAYSHFSKSDRRINLQMGDSSDTSPPSLYDASDVPSAAFARPFMLACSIGDDVGTGSLLVVVDSGALDSVVGIALPSPKVVYSRNIWSIISASLCFVSESEL